MISLLSILAVGFALGMRHATDADHVVAVSTIMSRERSLWRAAAIGLIWGVGHSLTILVVGSAILFFGWVVPARLGLGLEFSVGLMLVGLGAWSLKAFGSEPQALAAGPGGLTAETSPAWPGHIHPHLPGAARPLLVGIVHGLAGSAAVALLVLPIFQNHLWAVIYLVVFGAGTVAGMMLVTATMALPLHWSVRRSTNFHRGLGRLAAVASVGFGAFLLYDIGVVQGLLVR
jgi:hypothetical protein